MPKVAAVILAGGLSSRMGACKSQLEYQGQTFLEHLHGMFEKAGVPRKDIFVSGSFEGYQSIPDPQAHKGPAVAMSHVMKELFKTYGKVVFVPVDMPKLPVSLIKESLEGEGYMTEHIFPVVVKKRQPIPASVQSVQELVQALELKEITLSVPNKHAMQNINTPEDFKRM